MNWTPQIAFLVVSAIVFVVMSIGYILIKLGMWIFETIFAILGLDCSDD